MSPCNNIVLVEKIFPSLPIYGAWIIIIVLLFICGLFCASENAFSSSNKYHFRVLSERGSKINRAAEYLIDNFDDTLITVLIGNNAMQFIMSYLITDIFLELSGFDNNWPTGSYSIIATIVMTLLIYVFTDSLFKIISKAIPNKLTYFLCYFNWFFYILLFPIVKLFKVFIYLIHKAFKIKEKNILTREDFIVEADKAINEDNEIINEGKEEELLEPDEINILNKAFYFDMIKVSQVLTPSDKIISIDINGLTTKKLNKIILSTQYSRLPVYEKDKNNIIGVLTIKNYFKEYMKDNHVDIRGTLNKPLFIEDNLKIDDIFELFNREKTHIGFILDSNKKLIGMVTMDDILEELVGDIDEKKINQYRENKYVR